MLGAARATSSFRRRMTALPISIRTALAVALLALLAFQLMGRSVSDAPKAPSGPLRHQVLPSIPVERLSSGRVMPGRVALGTILGEPSGCSVLVVMSHTCPVCRQMRWTWQERILSLADSLKEPLRALWLFDGSTSDIKEFLKGGENASIEILRMAGDLEEAYQQLGVVGTPLAYILSDRGTLRLGILGDRVPSVGEIREFCG